MAEQAEDITPDETPGYKPPAEKKLEDIVNLDQEDESLKKYKEQLLGTAASSKDTVFFKDDPRRVIISKMALLVEGRPDVELDLSGDLSKKKHDKIILKEECKYKVKIYFHVQREIVTGMKYVHKLYRKGIPVDKETYMVGSYGPKKELQSYTTPLEDCPSGMLARGTYNVKSLFTDDDKNKHLEWEWQIEIKKDWQ